MMERPRTDVVGSRPSIDILRKRTRAVDWAALSAIPLILIGVFVVPRSIRLDYVLAYQRPTLATMYTAHFVHLSRGHLGTNLLAYATVVPLAYLFSLLADRRSEFHVAFVTFVLSFPIALSSINVLLVRPRIGFGFSGIVASFLGFLPLTLFWVLEARFDGRFDPDHAPVLFFLGTGVIAVWGIPRSQGSLVATAIAVLAGLFYVRRIVVDLVRSRSVAAVPLADGPLTVVGLGLSVFVVFVLAAFPSDPAGDGTVVNLLLHLLGYCFGFVVPYTAFRVCGCRIETTCSSR